MRGTFLTCPIQIAPEVPHTVPALTSLRLNKEKGYQPQLSGPGFLTVLQTPRSLSGKQAENRAIPIKHAPRSLDQRLPPLSRLAGFPPPHQGVPTRPVDVPLGEEQVPEALPGLDLTGPDAERSCMR